MTPQSKERLLRLADLLENLPKDGPRFDMEVWYKCGTTACAVGHACLNPWFRRRGLKLGEKNNLEYAEPEYRGDTEKWAAAAFFNIGLDEAEYLFYPDRYPNSHRSARYVAKRIRSFVRKAA